MRSIFPVRLGLLALLLPLVPAGGALALPIGAASRDAAELIPVVSDGYTAYPQHRRHGPNGGYHVNRMGYGNYTRGADGGFGGYPAGSAGAQILQEQQRRKCQAVPETC